MLAKIIISFTLVCIVGVAILVSCRDTEDKWGRIIGCALIVGSIGFGIYECVNIIKLRNSGQEIHLCYQIATDGNSHYPQDKVFYVRKIADSTYSVYDIGNHAVLDNIHYLGIHRIGANAKDTFDLIKYVSPEGDTLLYDAYLGESIKEEQFVPHYKKEIYWEFNYSN